MAIRCPNCDKELRLTKPAADGTRVQCPACQQPFTIGSAATPSPAEAGPFPQLNAGDESWSARVKRPKRPGGKSKPRTTAAGRSRKKTARSKNPLLVALGVVGSAALTVLIVVLLLGGSNSEPQPDEIVVDGDNSNVDERRADDDDGARQPPLVVGRRNPIAPKIKLAGATAPEPPAGGDAAQLKRDVLGRVKAATVLLRVTDATGVQGTGTGFFAIDKSIIITNAHVVGMLAPGTQNPLSVEIVLNSGEQNERKLAGHVTAVDRDSDLAVVQFRNDEGVAAIPKPLQVFSATKLFETQNVFVFGFPLGEAVGKNITVSKSSVSSMRKDKSGRLKHVQVNGGMHPGNSGGPVVDSNGSVVGIAVSGIPGTQINFAIPGNSLYRMLNGRISGLSLGDVKQVDKQFWLPVTVHAVDPLERLSKVQVDWWVGKPGKPREPSTSLPVAGPDDSKRTTVSLVYSNGLASGTLTIPPVAEGQTLYIQPAYESTAGEKRWVMSVNYDPGPLLKQEQLVLAHKPRMGKSDLYFTSRGEMKIDYFRGTETSITSRIDARLVENTQSVTPKAVRKRISIDKFDWDIRAGRQKSPRVEEARPLLLRHLKDVAITVEEDALGAPRKTNVEIKNVPKDAKEIVQAFSKQLVDSLDLVTVPTPGKEIPADSGWTSIRRAPFDLPGAYTSGEIGMAYTYKGVATYYKHRVAVIQIRGNIPMLANESVILTSKAQGKAYFDLASQRILVAELTLSIDLHARIGSDRAKATGQTRIRLSRIPLK